MRPNKETTYIGIGKTDGFRYIAIHPPVTLAEAGVLKEDGLVEDIASVEQVRGGIEHTLLGVDSFAYRSDQPADIGKKLADIRGHSLRLQTGVEVQISEGKNTEVIFDAFNIR